MKKNKKTQLKKKKRSRLALDLCSLCRCSRIKIYAKPRVPTTTKKRKKNSQTHIVHKQIKENERKKKAIKYAKLCVLSETQIKTADPFAMK